MTDYDAFLAEYSTWVDRVHRSTPGANIPPADLWQRILAQANPQPKETNQMSAITTVAVPMAPARPVDSRIRGGFGHYMNLVATIALVLAVAVAGWFATMQLNQPGGSEPRFAATAVRQDEDEAGNGVCDVKPLTVEKAIQIVQSPMFYVYGGEENAREDGWGQILDEGGGHNFVGGPHWDWSQLTGLTPHAALPVSEQDFMAAHSLAEEYRDCLQTGTRGQVWALIDPVIVQFEIVSRIPLLQPMDETRSAIEELLSQPTFQSTAAAQNDRKWQVNSDSDLAVRVDHAMSFHTTRSLLLPIQILDRDGATIASYDIYGNQIQDGGAGSGDAGNIVMSYSRVTETWYVVGSYETARFHTPDRTD